MPLNVIPRPSHMLHDRTALRTLTLKQLPLLLVNSKSAIISTLHLELFYLSVGN